MEDKMRLIFWALVLVFSCELSAVQHVKGHIRKKSGKYVQPYYKTSPNKTKMDNYSTKGNVNPYTGKKGSEDPYAIKK